MQDRTSTQEMNLNLLCCGINSYAISTAASSVKFPLAVSLSVSLAEPRGVASKVLSKAATFRIMSSCLY